MTGFLKRLFMVGSAEAHALVDKIEDPIKITEQAIRSLKKDLQTSLESFAEVKAITNRYQGEMGKNRLEMENWERKAMSLLQKGKDNQMEATESERLASEALARKESCTQGFVTAQRSFESQNAMVNKMQHNIQQLKSQISKYENELVTLKARSKTARATQKINKQLSTVDSGSTVALLERMKQKIEEEEYLAEAYGDMADTGKSVDQEIEQALLASPQDGKNTNQAALEALKSKMGIQ